MDVEEKPKLVDYKFDVLGGDAVFIGTRVQIRSLFDYLAGGHPLQEFLDDFPTVSRELAVAVLHDASARFDDEAVFDECERRDAEMDAHPETVISQEEFERGLRERFPFLTEKAAKKERRQRLSGIT